MKACTAFHMFIDPATNTLVVKREIFERTEWGSRAGGYGRLEDRVPMAISSCPKKVREAAKTIRPDESIEMEYDPTGVSYDYQNW